MAIIGQVIDDKYEILKQIGRGGTSRVYLAMDKRLNKQWAVKEIKKNQQDSKLKRDVEAAIAEADMIKELDHPTIVRIVDIIDDEDVIYIIEDYIEGESLSSVLEKEGAQPQELVIEWAIQLCKALDYLHTRKKPIIYRDMKPANIMLKPDGSIRLIDFGIAREFKDEKAGDTEYMGTRGYAAPEQFGGRGQTDSRTDIYCLGVTLYHLLTGKNPSEPPYEIYPIRHWNPKLSAGIEHIVSKCTKINPQLRYQNCDELLYDLLHYEELTAEYRERLKKKLNKFIASAVISVLCLCFGTVGLVMNTITLNSDYRQNITYAETTNDMTQKTDYYCRAIDIKPDFIETYIKLMDSLKSDTRFTVEEEHSLLKKINENLNSLKKKKEYPEMAFELGKLYWYYYDYGDSGNDITKMKSAIQWFEDATIYGNQDDEFYDMAKIYCNIGKFNRDINLNIEEASDNGTYLPYWNALNELMEFSKQKSGENEIVDLEVYKLCFNSIETYARKFKTDGVDKSNMEVFYNTVKGLVDSTETTSDKTQELKESLISREFYIETAIDNAYRKQVKSK